MTIQFATSHPRNNNYLYFAYWDLQYFYWVFFFFFKTWHSICTAYFLHSKKAIIIFLFLFFFPKRDIKTYSSNCLWFCLRQRLEAIRKTHLKLFLLCCQHSAVGEDTGYKHTIKTFYLFRFFFFKFCWINFEKPLRCLDSFDKT